VDDSSLDIDLLASSLHADDGDVQILLRALVERLSGALGNRLSVVRQRARLFSRGDRSDRVERISVTLGNDQFDAAVVGGALRCTVGRSSGGIRIRSSEVPMHEWLRALLGALAEEATTSSQTRRALEAIVIGGA
jgi:hypothetical protein